MLHCQLAMGRVQVSIIAVILVFTHFENKPVQGSSLCSSNCTECGGGDGQSVSGLCKCDGNCGSYGDCCGRESSLDLDSCAVNVIAPMGVDFVCRSIYPDNRITPGLNEAFWMVSSCPNSWSTDGVDLSQLAVEGNCSSLSNSLPPVTDLDTGTVYANEFCAVCNGVANLLAWQPNLACTAHLYEQLSDMSTSIQELLENDPLILQTQCQICSYKIPTTNVLVEARPCFPSISSCLNVSQLENLTLMEFEHARQECINGPYDLMSKHTITDGSDTVYRNINCAICNEDITGIDCFNPSIRNEIPTECVPNGLTPTLNSTLNPDSGGGEIGGGGGQGIPFTITLSNLGGGQVEVSILSETVTVAVDCPEGQAALGLECRPTLCPEGYVESGGQCSFAIKTINTTSISVAQCSSAVVILDVSNYTQLTNNTVLYKNQIHTVIKYTSNGQPVVCVNNSFIGDSIFCPTGLVALNSTEFTRLGNATVFFEQEVYDVVKFDSIGRAIICPPNETQIVQNSTIYSYPVGYFILTYIGCSLSVVGCALVLLTYGLFKSLQTLPSLILMNLATAILANNLLILIGGPVTQAFSNVGLCTVVAVLLHFFFLAQLTWMSVMSFQMARTFYQAKRLISTTEHKKCAFLIYFFLGWGVPLFITTVSIIVDFTTDSLVSYGVLSDGRLGSCWINHAESAVVVFVVPLVLTMIINFILFIVVTVLLCLAAQSSAKVDRKQNLSYFRINAAVFSVTGLTWIFGFIALLAGTSWAWYPFIIFNSTQGFMIFVAFLFTKRVLHLYWKLLTCHRAPMLSRSTTQNTVNSYSLQSYTKTVETNEKTAAP